MSGGPLCIIKMAIGLLTSSHPARPHYAYHTILANLTHSFIYGYASAFSTAQ